jgi:classical protein kinase C
LRALRKVDHRFFINLQCLYEDANAIYIVADFFSKGDLLQRVKKGDKMDADADAASYIRSLLLALEFLHDEGLMHRDVKLENILLTTNDINQLRAVLTDLGLACFCDEEERSL